MERENNDAPIPFLSVFQNVGMGIFDHHENQENYNEMIEDMNYLSINNNFKRKILKPKDYQLKIFEKAKTQNSIIYVETGKGKTFIAIMLMAQLLNISINSEKKQKINNKEKIIFFVCDTALVDQQKKEIENILNIEVGTIQGKKDKKSKNDYESFRQKWKYLNVFVAIPSIIYKLLSCGFINIFEISMLIFDECHHTTDDHSYNKIMHEFYFFYKKKKELDNLKYPRIYGLTASPIKTGLKGGCLEATAIESLQKLSENLDCVVIIDPEMIKSNVKDDDIYIEVKYHTGTNEYKHLFLDLYNECFYNIMWIGFSALSVSNPNFSTNDYMMQYMDYLKIKFKAQNIVEYNKICQNYIHLYNLNKYSPFFIIFEKLQRHIFMLLENLCLDSIISYFEALINNYNKIYQRKIEENNSNNSNNSISLKTSDNEEDDDYETDLLHLDPETIKELKDIYLNIYQKLKERKEKENYISDRLQQLYKKIDDLFDINNNSKIIIFIANRIVAHFLKPALSSFLIKKHKNKKCDEIIGINKQKSGGGTTLTPSLTLKKMNEIISEFNEDKFDILIGTSVIEEGLDIQSCNAVLALVELNTPKNYIQIKGRARQTNSLFYIFTNSEKQARLKVKSFLSIGQKMNDSFGDEIVKDFRRKDYIYKKPNFFFDLDKTSHSKITMGNVSMFFNEIIQQIESSGVRFKTKIDIENIKSNKGIQEYEYRGKVYLSTNLVDLQEKFPYTTEKQNTKENAKKMCYLYVIMNLKHFKYLDCHLKFCNYN